MPGLVPGIHVSGSAVMKDVDGRDKLGHDELTKPNPAAFPIQFSNSGHCEGRKPRSNPEFHVRLWIASLTLAMT